MKVRTARPLLATKGFQGLRTRLQSNRSASEQEDDSESLDPTTDSSEQDGTARKDDTPDNQSVLRLLEEGEKVRHTGSLLALSLEPVYSFKCGSISEQTLCTSASMTQFVSDEAGGTLVLHTYHQLHARRVMRSTNVIRYSGGSQPLVFWGPALDQ